MKKTKFGISGCWKTRHREFCWIQWFSLLEKNFSFRSGMEHLNLKFGQFTSKPSNEKESEKLVYKSFGEKNTPQRCLVRLYKKYVSKCSESGMAKHAFYLTPRRAFKDSDDGKSVVQQISKVICKC